MPLAEKGRFRVKVLPEIEPLKILPVVPVARTVTPESVAAKVICPAVVVVMVMLEPAMRLVGAYLAPVPSAANNCPVTVGAVLVAVPPLATAKTPETSLLPKAIAPLNSAPAAVLLTGRAEERLAMVVVPKALMENRVLPVEEATISAGLLPAEPTTVKVFSGVVVLMPTRDKAVTRRMELVEELETLKGSNMPVP